MPTPKTETTPQLRVDAVRYLYEADMAAIPRCLAALASDVETLVRAPCLSYLQSVESTTAELRRRLTRTQLAEDVLR